MYRGASWATVLGGHKESDTTKQSGETSKSNWCPMIKSTHSPLPQALPLSPQSAPGCPFLSKSLPPSLGHLKQSLQDQTKHPGSYKYPSLYAGQGIISLEDKVTKHLGKEEDIRCSQDAHSSPGITPPGITFQSVITRLIRYHQTIRIRHAVRLVSICLFAELLLFSVLLKHYVVSSRLIHKSLILSVFKRFTNESFFLLSLIRNTTLGKTVFCKVSTIIPASPAPTASETLCGQEKLHKWVYTHTPMHAPRKPRKVP